MNDAEHAGLARTLAEAGPEALLREPARSLIAALERPVVVADERGRVILANSAAVAAYGPERTAPGASWCAAGLGGAKATGPCGQAFPGRPDCAVFPGASGLVCLPRPEGAGVAASLEKRYRLLAENMGDVVWTMDHDFRFTYVSPSVERVLGYDQRTARSMNWRDVLTPAGLEMARTAFSALRERLAAGPAGQTPSEFLTEVRRPDGRVRAVQVRAEPRFDRRGRFLGLIGLSRDVTDRVAAERALRESERRYRAIVEDQTEIVCRLRPDGVVAFANQACARFFGAGAAELPGWDFLGRVHEPDRDYLKAVLGGLGPGGSKSLVRARLLGSSGPPCWFEWTLRAIGDPNGEVGEYQLVGRDIAEWMRAEEDLIQSEAQYRSIFEHSAEGIFQFLPDGRVVVANPALARILGYASPEDFLAEKGDVFRRIHVEHEDRLEFLRRLARHGRVLDYESRVYRRDGRKIWLSINARAIRDAHGDLVRVEGAARDITARKKAEEERMLLVAAVAQCGEGVVIVGRDFEVEYANPAYAQIVGLSRWPKETPPVETELAAGLTPFLSQAARSLLAQGYRWSGRVRHVRPDGAEALAETLISPIRDDCGIIRNHVVLIRDVTYESGLERRLRQAEKLEAIGVLAGGIAHDFNNILTPIVLNTELALADLSPEHPVHASLGQVLGAAGRARDLIRQILAFSRGGERRGGEPLTVNSLVKESLRLVGTMLPDHIRLTARLSDEPLSIMAEPAQIHQVLMNLCLNAAQAMPEGAGELRVALETVEVNPDGTAARPAVEPGPGGTARELPPGRHVRLEVADTGQGMERDVIERIFEPFFTTKPPGQGTGLGLAAVHGIVRSFGGTIFVDSAPGRGTRFEVFFPLLDVQLNGMSKSS